MAGKKFSRQGVEAAAQLAISADIDTWSRADGEYGNMLQAKGGTELIELDEFCQTLVPKMRQSKVVTKDELLKIVQWKFLKGKPRHALMNHLRANSEKSVLEHTSTGMNYADQGDDKMALSEISRLRGVGPATASAILSLYKPDMFAFMDDEVIECLYDGKRGYTTAIYNNINKKCKDIAEKLGSEWNPCRVGRALWTAARIKATLSTTGTGSKLKQDDSSIRRPSKRRKT